VHFDVLTGSPGLMSIALPAILPIAACLGAPAKADRSRSEWWLEMRHLHV
jgi:hypothetical protein